MKLDLNPEFRRALGVLEDSQRHLFLTGRAGTGKSTLLEYFRAHTARRPVLLAPTGVAALHVAGQTVHSFFRFPIDVTVQKIEQRKLRPRNRRLYKQLELIIIDEASMLRADLLDCVDAFLRMYGPRRAPFGGVQMVFVGDLYQLPPVVMARERSIFNEHYATPYFFSARACADLDFEFIELQRVYRQQDQGFIELLNRVRNNTVDDADLATLNQHCDPAFEPGAGELCVNLTTINRRADQVNERHLAALPGRLYRSQADVEGDFGKEYYPTATTLAVKPGAQVMMLSNDSDQLWVNGSMGTVQGTGEDDKGEATLNVLLQNGTEVEVRRHTWEVVRFALEKDVIIAESVGKFTQFPLRLAWAVTIHKGQGKTFERVLIDLTGGVFTPGQLYVALSRCTTLEGIVLKQPLSAGHVQVDYRIRRFLVEQRTRRVALSVAQKRTLIHQAIERGQHLALTYVDGNDTQTQRIVIPHGTGTETYRGVTFEALRAWCTLRRAERVFHLARILTLKPAPPA